MPFDQVAGDPITNDRDGSIACQPNPVIDYRRGGLHDDIVIISGLNARALAPFRNPSRLPFVRPNFRLPSLRERRAIGANTSSAPAYFWGSVRGAAHHSAIFKSSAVNLAFAASKRSNDSFNAATAVRSSGPALAADIAKSASSAAAAGAGRQRQGGTTGSEAGGLG